MHVYIDIYICIYICVCIYMYMHRLLFSYKKIVINLYILRINYLTYDMPLQAFKKVA